MHGVGVRVEGSEEKRLGQEGQGQGLGTGLCQLPPSLFTLNAETLGPETLKPGAKPRPPAVPSSQQGALDSSLSFCLLIHGNLTPQPHWLGLGPCSKPLPRLTVYPEGQGNSRRAGRSSEDEDIPLSPIMGLICVCRSSPSP